MKKRILSLLLALTLVMSLLPFAVAADTSKFTDVSKDSWYKTYVDDVVSKGYFKGTSETTFEPETYMTRAMFVTVLARLDGAKVDDSKSAFADVPANMWYTGSVAWAAQNGIVNGVEAGKFAPNDSITREQMCAIMDRYLTYYAKAHNVTINTKKNAVSFSDQNAISTWAAASVASCVNYGLILGCGDGTFQPAAFATRAQVAAVISRLAVTANRISGGGGGFRDDDDEPIELDPNDLIGKGVQATVAQFNAQAGTHFAFSAVETADDTRLQKASIEIPVTADVLTQVIDKTALLTVTLLNSTPDDRADLKEDVNSAVDAAIEILEEELGINLSKSTTAAEIKAAVYEKAVPLAKSYWANFHDGEGTYYTSKVTVSSKNYSVDVIVDEANSTTTLVLPAGMMDKATLVSKFAADVAKDFYADLKAYDEYTSVVEVKATVNVEFADSASCAAQTESFPHNYPYEVAIKLDAGVNGEYKFDGRSYLKLNVTEDAQAAYAAAVQDVAETALNTETVKAQLDKYVAQMVVKVKASGDLQKFADAYAAVTGESGTAAVNAAVDEWVAINLQPEGGYAESILALQYLNNDPEMEYVYNNAVFCDLIEEIGTKAAAKLSAKLDEQLEGLSGLALIAAESGIKAVKKSATADNLKATMASEGIDLGLASYPAIEKYVLSVIADKLNAEMDVSNNHANAEVTLAMEDEVYALLEGKINSAIENTKIKGVSIAAYIDKALNLKSVEAAKDLKLGNLATLLKNARFQSFVGTYGNSTIAKVTDYIAKLPASASVTVNGVVLDKAALADLQASTGTVDACNALAALIDVDGLKDLSLSSFDGDGVAFDVAAKGRTYGFNLVIDIQ